MITLIVISIAVLTICNCAVALRDRHDLDRAVWMERQLHDRIAELGDERVVAQEMYAAAVARAADYKQRLIACHGALNVLNRDGLARHRTTIATLTTERDVAIQRRNATLALLEQRTGERDVLQRRLSRPKLVGGRRNQPAHARQETA